MKLILGDNQFFGINHHDLQKGNKTKMQFSDEIKINDFIRKTINLGMDGFMINSNDLGYKIINNYSVVGNEEIHYSIPYPHKYASMVNEEGMLSLLKYFISKTSIFLLIRNLPSFVITRNIKYLIPLVVSLEIPKNLPVGSTVYIQNIITDLVLGIKRFDLLEAFASEVRRRGFRPGLITLNPVLLNTYIKDSTILNQKDLVVCFNINEAGFNVFPSRSDVSKYIKEPKPYKLMGMSIFSSGGGNIEESIMFIKKLNLDYLVFGSSKLENIKFNIKRLIS